MTAQMFCCNDSGTEEGGKGPITTKNEILYKSVGGISGSDLIRFKYSDSYCKPTCGGNSRPFHMP